jgi:hypothetical protein
MSEHQNIIIEIEKYQLGQVLRQVRIHVDFFKRMKNMPARGSGEGNHAHKKGAGIGRGKVGPSWRGLLKLKSTRMLYTYHGE